MLAPVAWHPKKEGGWTKTVKPRPAEIDEWTHYLHDPSNNAVAHDRSSARRGTCSGSPARAGRATTTHVQRRRNGVGRRADVLHLRRGATAPRFCRPEMDAGGSRRLQRHGAVEAADGEVAPHLYPFKSGPAYLARRLVAVGDRVYVTLGEDPLVKLGRRHRLKRSALL